MIVLLVLTVVLIILLQLRSRGRYGEDIDELDKKDYPLKDYVPMGLVLVDWAMDLDAKNPLVGKLSPYISKYNSGLKRQLSELFDKNDVDFYLDIHWANKVPYLLVALLLISINGVRMKPPTIGFYAISLAVLVAVAYGPDNDLKKKVKMKYDEIQTDFPDFVMKMTLLINAGMSVQGALKKVTFEGDGNKFLYKELIAVQNNMEAGVAFDEALEDLAYRCKSPEMTKFVSVLLQNYKKGGNDLVSVLNVQAKEAMIIRKNSIMRLGEEANTKMLLPMMIMLVAVLLLVATPAILLLSAGT